MTLQRTLRHLRGVAGGRRFVLTFPSLTATVKDLFTGNLPVFQSTLIGTGIGFRLAVCSMEVSAVWAAIIQHENDIKTKNMGILVRLLNMIAAICTERNLSFFCES